MIAMPFEIDRATPPEEAMTRRPVRCTLASVLILALTSLGEAPAQSSRPASKRHHWAFRTLAPQVVPRVRQAEQVRTPIDAFVLSKLEERGLDFAPEADRVTLARRACLDLVGVPPPPELVDAYLADDRPGAYERLIDRLLASPQY